MLGTLMTVLFLITRVVGQFGSWMYRKEPRRSQVYQPLPWQVQNVTQNRRSSGADEKDRGSRRSSMNSKCSTARGTPHSLAEEANNITALDTERAAVTIQSQYRRYQQRKKYERNP